MNTEFEYLLQGEGEVNKITLWLEDVDKVYKEFKNRINGSVWKELLNNEVCTRLDTVWDAGVGLLSYILKYPNFPHYIWKLLDCHFNWIEKSLDLKNNFTKDELIYMENRITYDDELRYEFFIVEEEKDYDTFIELYNQIGILDLKKDLVLIENKIFFMDKLQINHPDFLIVKMRVEISKGKEHWNINKAIITGRKLYEICPTDIRTFFALGELAVARGNYINGCQLFIRVLHINEAHLGALIGLGDTYFLQGNFHDAIEYYSRAQEIYPYNQEAFERLCAAKRESIPQIKEEILETSGSRKLQFKLAQYYYDIGEYEEAYMVVLPMHARKVWEPEQLELVVNIYDEMKMYEEALQKAKVLVEMLPDANSYSELGLVYQHMKKYEDAFRSYEEGLKKDSSNTKCLYRKAYVLNKLKRYYETIGICKKGIKLGKEKPNFYMSMAEAQYKLKKYDDALHSTNKGIVIVPYPEFFYIQCQIYIKLERYKDIISTIDKLVKQNLATVSLFEIYISALVGMGEITRALEEIDKLKEIDPDNSNANYELASILFERRKYKEAINAVTIAIEKNSSEEKLLLKANLYLVLQMPLDALRVLLPMATDEVENNNINILIGDIYFDRASYEKAIKYYLKAELKNPRHTEINYKLSDAYRKMEDFKMAAEHMRRHTTKSPSLDSFNKMSVYYLKTKQFEAAINGFKKALEYDSENGLVYYNLGLTYYKMGKLRDALDNFLEAIESSYIDEKLYLNIVELTLRLRDYEKAFQYSQKAIDLYEGEDIFHFQKVRSLVGMKNYGDALRELKVFEEDDKYYIEYLLLKAEIYFLLRKIDEGIKCYKDILSKVPTHFYALYKLATVNLTLCNYNIAFEMYEQLLELDPDSVDVLCDIGYVEQLRGNKKESLNYLKAALVEASNLVELDNRNPCHYFKLGKVYYHLNDYSYALNNFKNAIANYSHVNGCVYSNCFHSLLYTAKTYEKKKDFKKAYEYYVKASELSDDKESREGILRLQSKE